MKKRVFSILLAAVMMLSLFAIGFYADSEAETARATLQNSMASFQRYSNRVVLEENQLLDAVVIYRNELVAAQTLLDGELQEASAYTSIRASLVSKWQAMRRILPIGNDFEIAFNKLYNSVSVAQSAYTPESWADVEAAYATKTTAIVNGGTDAQCKACMTALQTAIDNLVAASSDNPADVAAKNAFIDEMPVFQAYSDRIVMSTSQTAKLVVRYRSILATAYDLIEGELQEASVYTAKRAALVTAWQDMRLSLRMGVMFEREFDALYVSVAVNEDLYTPESWQAVANAYALKTQPMIDHGTDLQCATSLTMLKNAIKNLQFAQTPNSSVINARVELYQEVVNGKFKEYSDRVILPANLQLADVISYNNELASVRSILEGELKTVAEYEAMRTSLVAKWNTMRNTAGIALAFQQQADGLYNQYFVNKSSYTSATWAALESAYAQVTERVINYGTDAQSLSVINAINSAIAKLVSTVDPADLEAKASLETAMPSFRKYAARVVLPSSDTNATVIAYRTELANAEELIANTTIQTASVYTAMRASLVSKWSAMRVSLKIANSCGTEMDRLYNSVSANSALYTADSWAAVETAYDGRTPQLINYGTDAQSASAIAALQTAIDNLVLLSEQITAVSMNTLPTKVDYLTGETVDVSGATILVVYGNGTSKIVAVTSAMLSAYDNSAAGTVAITVNYEGFTPAFSVTYAEPVSTSDVTFIINNGNDISTSKGSTVALPVSVAADSGMANCLLEITYDTSAMTFTGATGTAFYEVNETTSGRILVGFISSEALTSAATLFTLNFTVNATTVTEVTSIVVNPIEVVSATDDTLTYEVSNIAIEIA